MRNFMISVLVSATSAWSAQAVQTGWEDGPGVPGPESSWESTFDSCQAMSWFSVPGQLVLSSEPLENPSVQFVDTSIFHAYTVDAGDLNGDGFTDIAGGGDVPDGFCVYYGDGSGGWDRVSICAAAEGVTGCDIADINTDGHPDLLCTTYFGAQVLLYLNDGSPEPVWTEQVICDNFDGGHDVEAFDMDGDGDRDILAAAAEADRITWWRNDGGSPIQWHEQDIATDVDYPCRIQALDLNGDSCMDVVASMWTDGSVVSWYGSGGGSPVWTEELVYHPISGAHCVRACDIDDDGDHDLVVSALGGGNLILMRNGGGNPVQWTREYVSPQAACGYARPGDIDGDGDWDILSCSFGAGGAWWYENIDSGTSWVQHEITGGTGSMACSLPADVDSDGDLDVIVTCNSTNRILWCELTEFRSDGWLIGSILDTAGEPQWASLDWDALEPAGTDLAVSYRTSDNASAMGDWSSPLHYPTELSGLLDRYFQYRVEMVSSDSTVSPVLRSLEFNWDLTGILGDVDDGIHLSVVGGNPARGCALLRLTSAMDTSSKLSLFDCSGRMAWEEELTLSGGSTELLQLPALPAGNYRVLMRNDTGASGVLSLVLIR
ncbi:MAG: VCBS repeat-containing protein [Candidatus Fermentibacteraceae bacterium]|nr:VCBS repeat-containing protein [Candidatus Fermentibacteraceae bacterium]MBN2609402.1 VCBS repeat-containing protein [Candidatus Fermentibacteraceae bacterium]